ASSGLGRRFARVLHAAGATVVVSARREERLRSLADELGERVVVVAADVGDDSDRVALVEAAVKAGNGAFEVLVNNAGTSHTGPAEDEPFETFENVVSLNLNALFRLCQLSYEPLRAGDGGSIINIASMLGSLAGT